MSGPARLGARPSRVPREGLGTRLGRGWCKTWTLDSGLDSGLHFGLDFGLDIGLYFVRMALKACQRSLYLCLSGCLWEPKWGRRGVATLRSAGGGWGSILQDYFCWSKYRESGRSWQNRACAVDCSAVCCLGDMYQTDFVSVMTMLCVKFSAEDGLYPTGLFLRISEPWSLDGSGTERASC